MQAIATQLQDGINQGTELLNDISKNVGNDYMSQFEQVVTEYIDLYTKSQLYETLQQDSIIEAFKKPELDQAMKTKENIEREIQKYRSERENCGIKSQDELQKLLKDSKSVLKQLSEKIPQSNTTDYNKVIEMMDKEITNLKKTSEAYEWYESAYAKLSEFTQIEIIADRKYKLKKRYILDVYPTSVELENKEVFVADISPSEDTIGCCLAQVMERLNAFEAVVAAASKLGWNWQTIRDSPFALLIAQNGASVQVPLFGNNLNTLIPVDNISSTDFQNMQKQWKL